MSLFPRSIFSSFSRLSLRTSASTSSTSSPLASSSSLLLNTSPSLIQTRSISLVPRKTKYRKSHKGRIPIALGGSTKGTTLEWGDYGLRVNEPCRLSAKHLETAEAALKRGLKPVRGSKVYLRIFPDIPVCIKGNETRMGKGKGTFEFWACRARIGRVIFEIGGPNIRPEIAHAVMKLAAAKLPVTTEVIDRTTPPRVGFSEFPNLDLGPRVITKGEYRESLEVASVIAARELLGLESGMVAGVGGVKVEETVVVV